MHTHAHTPIPHTHTQYTHISNEGKGGRNGYSDDAAQN